MKLYKEPLIFGISTFIAVCAVIFSIATYNPHSEDATVDHKTPLPVLNSNQTIAELENTPGIGLPIDTNSDKSGLKVKPTAEFYSITDRLQKKTKIKPLSANQKMEIIKLNGESHMNMPIGNTQLP